MLLLGFPEVALDSKSSIDLEIAGLAGDTHRIVLKLDSTL